MLKGSQTIFARSWSKTVKALKQSQLDIRLIEDFKQSSLGTFFQTNKFYIKGCKRRKIWGETTVVEIFKSKWDKTKKYAHSDQTNTRLT